MAIGRQNNSWAVPPAPFRQSQPLILESCEGGGWLVLVGFPFLVGGCAIAYTIARRLATGDGLNGGAIPFAFSMISLIATTAMGAVLVFGRRWTVFDLGRGLLIRSYVLLVPLRKQQRLLSEFNAVVLAYDAGDSESPETYPVRLRSSRRPEFVVHKSQKYRESRCLADYLSSFLSLPLIDIISDHETVASPGENWRVARDQLQRTEMKRPECPANMRCQITESEMATRIVIPGSGGLPVHVLGIVLPLVVLLVLMPWLDRVLDRTPMLAWTRTALFILAAIMIIPPLLFVSALLIVRGTRKQVTVIASHIGLEIEQKNCFRNRRRRVPAADLLDVDSSTVEGAIQNIRAASNLGSAAQILDSVWWFQRLKSSVPTKGVFVKSRTELIRFGEGLPAEELQYLTWLLRQAVFNRRI